MICFSHYSALVATRFFGRYHGTRQLVTSHTWDSFRQENAFLNINFYDDDPTRNVSEKGCVVWMKSLVNIRIVWL